MKIEYGVRFERSGFKDKPYMAYLVTTDIKEAESLVEYCKKNYPEREAKIVIINENTD